MTAPVGLTLADLGGLWRRTLLQHEGQDPDRTTQVFWLQGPHLFIDLRQPADLPRFEGVHCLHDLTVDHLHAMARQEGFAGALCLDAAVAEWRRQIDFQSASGVPDRARLVLDGNVLIERGTEAPYLEEWSRETDPSASGWGARLLEMESGRSGFVVRVADQLMVARDRAARLLPGGSLARLLEAAETLQAKRDLLDFEISLGRIAPDGRWSIERSSLPFKQRRTWRVQYGVDAGVLAIDDVDPVGTPVTRRWQIVETDGPEGLGLAGASFCGTSGDAIR